MNNRWRTRATVAIVCVALTFLPLPVCWAVEVIAHIHLDNQLWVVAFGVSSLSIPVGVVFAIAGVRRGSLGSRVSSWACLSALLLLIATVAVLAVLLSRHPGAPFN